MSSALLDHDLDDLPTSAPRTTLGCECECPTTGAPGSALCGTCGLIHLSGEEYSAFLAERRAEVDRIVARVLTRRGDADAAPSGEDEPSPDPELPAESTTSATADAPDGPRRRWRLRGRRR